ncbi:TerB family tellurite resistance protein [Yoonia sediminilitoris]|uniref:Tellurite resistance protein TerB n=1 Tax=Yoonia sediminilitoris TaxID=1286148 RepID=A0A2T6KKE3_9RHOB|nr:TerB family tellurite resistance protein [Yoonia sediminilitoris]PUB16405.1 tellurite resistance protein TerB [Yoonia sediminilitoris]RCW96754.1 tellurite resistance protein TerB [Yoonia sediminilitoris]
MKNAFFAFMCLLVCAAPANALSFDDLRNLSKDDLRNFSIDDLMVEKYEFIAPTRIPSEAATRAPLGENGRMSLCYLTRGIEIFGYSVTKDVQSYVLASDGCAGTADAEIRPFDSDQMMAAQSATLNLIDANIPPVAKNDMRRNIETYGLLAGVALLMLAIIIKRLKSLLGISRQGPLRKKAAHALLLALCHAAKCDGLVASKEISMIGKTMKRLAQRNYSTAEIMRISDRVHINLSTEDYINFGKGLRDREKDLMLKGVLYVTMAGDRMLPAEYTFVSELAHGLGIPAEDFRRVMYDAFAEKEANPI